MIYYILLMTTKILSCCNNNVNLHYLNRKSEMPTFSLRLSQMSPNKDKDISPSKNTRSQSRKGKEPINTAGLLEGLNQETEIVDEDVNDDREERTKSKLA